MIPAPKIYSGKVRDTYQIGDGRLLMIASDRLSAFDVVLPTVIPDKGVILTQLSRFWFARLRGVVPNHLTGETVEDLGWARELTATIRGRSVIVRAAERIPLECVVRGYLAGSGLGEYKERGSIAGHALPAGLSLSDRLPEPIFTPARKNDQGHDENITRAQAIDDYGAELVRQLERISLELYEEASSHAAARGVLLADTKFEFGFIDGELNLIDELLTPDSSRFWDASTWAPGKESDSWDKQFVRNWLIASGWDREPPGPVIPDDVVAGTRQRYFDVFNRLTGVPLEKWLAGASMEQPA
ncbi:MAG: phosphoribosylaminoimidazolesuccinocarboxamide synthase [Chloroflexota bacterium]|nr:phosphoribosylaminoimidazolesuccinocarboxamide synthase [Chloroflexota bacterium]